MKKDVLDATAGGRMIWFQKEYPGALYVDGRTLRKGEFSRRPSFEIKPDVVASFTKLPFRSERFYLVVFDPPHTIRGKAGKGIIAIRYGRLLLDSWEETLGLGFSECWRVLKKKGTLVFKWAEADRRIDDISHLFPSQPLFGSRVGKNNKTIWLVFFKS